MKLADYLIRENMTNAAFARRIGLSKSAIGRLRSGQRQPSWPVMVRIISETKGDVQPNDFHAPAPRRKRAA